MKIRLLTVLLLAAGSAAALEAWLDGVQPGEGGVREFTVRSDDPDDLTLREARLLGTADLILHDPAVPRALPVAALLITLPAALVMLIAAGLDLPAMVTATLAVAALVITTGAFHEDGLADSCDGLFGGATPERRLEIMKDSRIGSYGGIALVLALLVRWSAIATLLGAGACGLALAPAILSRAAMGLVMSALPNARAGGLAAAHGKPSMVAAGLGAALALGLAIGLVGWAALGLALAVGVTAAAFAQVARAKIGGQTGDVLGAVQVLTEIAALATATALLQ